MDEIRWGTRNTFQQHVMKRGCEAVVEGGCWCGCDVGEVRVESLGLSVVGRVEWPLERKAERMWG